MFLADFFGRTHLERAGAHLTVFLHDGRNLLEQYDDGVLRRSVVSSTRDDDLLLVSSGGAELYLLSDLLGSVRYIFDDAGKRGFYVYDEFGNLRSPAQPFDENPFRFAGKRVLGSTGKYDFAYRVYDPLIGKFQQRDPKGYVDGTDPYAFLRNNPLVRTDALGLESRSEHDAQGEPASSHAQQGSGDSEGHGALGPVLSKIGALIAYRHPPGFTLAVPDSFDNDKVRAYKARINSPLDRGVGIRSRPPGAKTATDDIRRSSKHLSVAYESSLPGGRPRGTDIDHSVELQHIIRGNSVPGADTVRPQDHRVQSSGLNRSQGSTARTVKQRQIDSGAPLDTSAGGVSRQRDMHRLRNRQGFRTGMRYFAYADMFTGTAMSLSSVGDDIREGRFGSATLNTSGYLGGAFEIAGLIAKSPSLLKAGRFLGAPAAVIGAGVTGVRIGTHLYDNYVDQEMVLDAGSWVEEHTGSRVLGATAGAYVAVNDAILSAPEAAYDFVAENWTLNPDEIDWGRTFNPFEW